MSNEDFLNYDFEKIDKRHERIDRIVVIVGVCSVLIAVVLAIVSNIIREREALEPYPPQVSQLVTISASVPPPTIQPLRTHRPWITTVPANVPPLTVAELDNVEYVGDIHDEPPKHRYTLTSAEKHLLKFVADREDSYSVESRLAVMQVVMNRVNDNRFPDTVRDVLFQHNQFHVMPRYHTSYVPSAQACEALERLLYDDCIFGGANAIFFAAARVSPDRIARRLYLIAEIGGSRFWGQTILN